VALTLGLGLHGLKNGLAPQAGAGDDVALPRDLPAALDALERSTVLRELLGRRCWRPTWPSSATNMPSVRPWPTRGPPGT
jgi:glutamine synthetase